MQPAYPLAKDLVLLGGGHAHVSVLKSFGMQPIEGVRVTLVNRDIDTPYSGMLPGLIAGHYTRDEAHIDLGRLSRFAGARFLHDEAIGIEPHNNRLLFRNRPPVPYDVLSIDTGSTPHTAGVPGAEQYSVPVKPISNFLERWSALCERALNHPSAMRIAVAGAGAGGVEMLLAAQYRLTALRTEHGIGAPVNFDLFSAAPTPLPGFDASVRRKFARVLQERGINVHSGHRVSQVEQGVLILDNGERHMADEILWVTDACAPDWFRNGGLATDEKGFVRVNACLQSVSHANVFAAGDVAAVDDYPRPKAGVFAVRQGPPLTDNLRNALLDRPLKPFSPQKEFLKLVSTGDRYAVAARNGMALEGAWVWRWKDWIDRRFMERFQNLLPMQPGVQRKPFAQLTIDDAPNDHGMRCGGCGAKIGADTLALALHDLKPLQRDDVIAGLESPDDAAIVRAPAGKLLVQTVDSFRAMVEDPYVFGKIAANHALSDIYAMGGAPQTALAIATLPHGAAHLVANDLRHMMAGAVEVLNAAGAALVGGHSSEGAELTLGFAINGLIDEARALRKSGLRAGDVIIATKPLGTGILFAGDMQYRARSQWIEAALQSMLASNAPAAQCFANCNASAATDITGFGLAGHLGEMARASSVCIAIDPQSVPVLEGANELMAGGIFSTLQVQNERLAAELFASAADTAISDHKILFDPQTSGGLVASIGPAEAQNCLTALRDAGYPHAAVIGTVEHRPVDGPWLVLKHAKS